MRGKGGGSELATGRDGMTLAGVMYVFPVPRARFGHVPQSTESSGLLFVFFLYARHYT